VIYLKVSLPRLLPMATDSERHPLSKSRKVKTNPEGNVVEESDTSEGPPPLTDLEPNGSRPEQSMEFAQELYDDLRRIAGQMLRQERSGHTLQPTALVHEAYLRMAAQNRLDSNDRSRVLALGAQMIRRILVDHARKRKAAKRGGAWRRVTLAGIAMGDGSSEFDMLELDEALTKLRAIDDRQASVVELRYFAGMTELEVAELLGVSDRTVRADWTHAKAWLFRRLEGQRDGR
jgi:RNA polymerase sigma factor (TIGR02999 family)